MTPKETEDYEFSDLGAIASATHSYCCFPNTSGMFQFASQEVNFTNLLLGKFGHSEVLTKQSKSLTYL